MYILAIGYKRIAPLILVYHNRVEAINHFDKAKREDKQTSLFDANANYFIGVYPR